MKILAVCLLSVMVLMACSTLQSNDMRAQLAVTYAAEKIIRTEPARAVRVLDEVEKARAYLISDEPVTIAALDRSVKSRINWEKLDPADRVLINAVLIEARERLEFEIGSGVLDEAQRVKVGAVLDWIAATAQQYAAP